MTIAGKSYSKGLGLAANAVLVYELAGKYKTLTALLGIADDARGPEGPAPSARLTIFADGHCRYDSGRVAAESGAIPVKVDLDAVSVLVIRVSSNWHDNGDYRNDLVNLVK